MTSQHIVRITPILLGLSWFGIAQVSAQANHDKTIRLTAIIQETPDQIKLDWLTASSPSYTITQQKIWRRTPGGTWGSEYDTLTTSALTYTDTEVVRGVRYEYRLVRIFSNGPLSSTGFIETGICPPEVDRRGSLILLVRDTAATALTSELTQLQQDLAGDGWHIIREDITAANTANTTLTFDPATLPFGDYFGCLAVSSNDPENAVINIDLDMKGGVQAPEIDLTGNNLTIAYNSSSTHLSNHTDFGERSLSDPTLVRIFTITNTGTAPPSP